jgi:hypothetical protein
MLEFVRRCISKKVSKKKKKNTYLGAACFYQGKPFTLVWHAGWITLRIMASRRSSQLYLKQEGFFSEVRGQNPEAGGLVGQSHQ